MTTENNKINWKRAVILYVLILIAVTWLSALWVEQKKSHELNVELLKLEQRLQNTLQHYQSIPKIIQKSGVILSALHSPSADTINAANRQLQEISTTLKADVSYLMAPSGLTIASSNYEATDSFVGESFSFRPYFKLAIAGSDASYFALGAISGRRGYYFASPVRDQQTTIGVIVVKVSLTFIEQLWSAPEMDFVISDVDGVIFFSSRLSWLYKTMYQLPQQRVNEIRASQRYGDAKLESISQYSSWDKLLESRVVLVDKNKQQSWIINSVYLPDWDWRMYSLAQRRTILAQVTLHIAIYTLIMLLIFVMQLYWGKRGELHIHLEEMNTQLEIKVNELTGEQQRTNSDLKNLVEHYRQTQTELQDTQTQLIQTAKLAVLGEFSAGLHHELAQPLQALQSYSSNCEKMLTLGKTERLQQNLHEINGICNTLAGIIAKFKIFARRTNPDPRPASLNEIIAATWTIVRPTFESMGVVFEDKTTSAQIFCEPVLVQQVLVNLLNNALQALVHTHNPRVRLASSLEGNYLNLRVEDNGPHVGDEQLSHLFDAFFTTKKSGLGLGLTISRRIIESQNGQISVMRAEGGGLAFNIKLSLYNTRDKHESNIIG